jgi:hypothetical protein
MLEGLINELGESHLKDLSLPRKKEICMNCGEKW